MPLQESKIIWHLLTQMRDTEMSANCCNIDPALKLIQKCTNFLLSSHLISISSSPALRKIKEEGVVQAIKALRSMLITGCLIRFFSPEQTALTVRGDLLVHKCIKIIKFHLIQSIIYTAHLTQFAVLFRKVEESSILICTNLSLSPSLILL